MNYSESKNKFVHLALHKTLTLITEMHGTQFLKDLATSGLLVDIVGDNDFYSQRAKVRIFRKCFPRALIPLLRAAGIFESAQEYCLLDSNSAILPHWRPTSRRA